MKETVSQFGPDTFDDAEASLARLRERPLVVKISGKVPDDKAVLDNILSQLVFLAHQQVQIVLVHGAGPQLDARLGDRILDDNGERVTPVDKIIDVRSVCAGVSLKVIKAIQAQAGEKAVTTIGPLGLEGAIRHETDNASGDIVEIDRAVYRSIGNAANQGPDFRPITVMGHVGRLTERQTKEKGRENRLLNINADNVAGRMAMNLGATKLLVMGSTKGIINPLTSETLGTLYIDQVEALIKEGVITEGMMPKARMARDVANKGTDVHIIPQSAEYGGLILRELLNKKGCPKRATLLTHFRKINSYSS